MLGYNGDAAARIASTSLCARQTVWPVALGSSRAIMYSGIPFDYWICLCIILYILYMCIYIYYYVYYIIFIFIYIYVCVICRKIKGFQQYYFPQLQDYLYYFSQRKSIDMSWNAFFVLALQYIYIYICLYAITHTYREREKGRVRKMLQWFHGFVFQVSSLDQADVAETDFDRVRGMTYTWRFDIYICI